MVRIRAKIEKTHFCKALVRIRARNRDKHIVGRALVRIRAKI